MSGRARPDEPLADWCEARFFGCYGRATDRHHVLRRSHGGGDERENTRDLCRWCHLEVIHRNPAMAYEQGWMKRGVA